MLDKSISEVNKTHSISFFGSFQKTSIQDLTEMKAGVGDSQYFNREEFRQTFLIGLPTHDKEQVISAVRELEEIDGIKYACPNYIYEDCATSANAVAYSSSYDDYDNQWALTQIQAKEAWDSIADDFASLTRIQVGIVDSGIANHPELEPNLVSGQRFFEENGVVYQDGDTSARTSHGTFVAGLVKAVCPYALLVPLRIDGFTASLAVEVVSYAISNDIGVLNFSIGVDDDNLLIYAISFYSGIIIASAGNEECNVICQPARYNTYDECNIISVGATKYGSDNIATSADWGSGGSNYDVNMVDIFAPGTNVISTSLSNGYTNGNGTSFSTALVTGAVVMILAKYPSLSAEEVKSVILGNADRVTSLIGKCSTGGRLNVLRSLNSLKGSYKVTFNRSGGSGGTEFIYVDYGQKMPKINPPSRNRYSFAGYYDSNGKEYYPGSDSEIFYDKTSGMTLTARWTPMSWTVVYSLYKIDEGLVDGGGDIITMQYDTAHPTYGTSLTAPELDGYTFKEWRKYYQYYQLNSEYEVCSTSQTVTIYNVVPPNNQQLFLTACYEKACVASGTLITLADGSMLPVEQLTGNETLLVWNLYTGTYDTAPILFIDNHGLKEYTVTKLRFSNGTVTEIINEHGFWDIGLNRYVMLGFDAAQFVGHRFMTQNGEEAVLIGVENEKRVTVAYSPVTYGHLCYYVNGMLSMPGGISGLFNIFEVDAEQMKFDESAMNTDIENYGLYTYEEFCEIATLPEEMFEALGGKYLKVAVGKGLISVERLQELTARYSKFFE